MKLIMSGIDWKNARIDQREKLSFTPNVVQQIVQRLHAISGVSGCVLLSTCNRTELYMTVEDSFSILPDMLLCREAGVSGIDFRPFFETRVGKQAVRHLMEVACGLCSQILGEDQIVTQVKTALELAREIGAADSVLQTLFRTAVTAGKETKTQVQLTAVPLSVASRAVELLETQSGGLAGKKVVVIGNGEMGRLASKLLIERGCYVTVTLRSYRHGETIVPAGCMTAPYDERMSVVDGCDILLSATTSPHFTVSYEQLCSLAGKPRFIVDLAMPRDIQPEIGGMEGVALFDMDSMQTESPLEINRQQIEEIQAIIKKNMDEFYRWLNFRNSIPIIDSIKEIAVRRALGMEEMQVLEDELDEEKRFRTEEAVERAVAKTVDMLLGGMKEAVTPELLLKCREKMIQKTPCAHAMRKVR